MTDGHTCDGARERLLRLVAEPSGTRAGDGLVGLAAQLGERVDGYVVRFAALLRQGVMAASVAIGLQVRDELMAAQAQPAAHPCAARQRRGVGDPWGPQGRGGPPAGTHRRRCGRGATGGLRDG